MRGPSTEPSQTAPDRAFVLTEPGTETAIATAVPGRPHRSPHLTDDGIWHLVRPASIDRVDAFCAAYGRLRAAEGRSVATAEAVAALPYRDLSGRRTVEWAQRAASFDRLLATLESHTPESNAPESSALESNALESLTEARAVSSTGAGRVVDVGAGCGWLAARLHARGWSAAAVDVALDDGDGLVAAGLHDAALLRVRAEMEHLPFARDSVELVVFNASLHYAASVGDALAEAARVVAPGGRIAIVDSPVFARARDATKMVEEFERFARGELGLPAAPLAGLGAVLDEDLERFVREHAPTAWVCLDAHPRGGGIRARLTRRRLGRAPARRPLVLATMGAS